MIFKMMIHLTIEYIFKSVESVNTSILNTRVRGIPRNVSARRWEGDWFDARPKLRHS